MTKALIDRLKIGCFGLDPIDPLRVLLDEVIEALAQPEQEPVAWVYPEGLDALKAGKPWTAYGTRQEPNNTALYLSPQPDIPPYEAKLKEKNFD